MAFYFLEILECKFALISKYKKLLTAKKECHHTCLTQCHVNPGEKRVNSLMVEIVNFKVLIIINFVNVLWLITFISILECNAARCDTILGYCVIGKYDKTKECNGQKKSVYEIKEKGTPSNSFFHQHISIINVYN